MKPTITWVVLANSRIARIIENQGPGKGFIATSGNTLQAPAPVENADRAGIHPISAAHGTATFERGDPKQAAEVDFANTIMAHLARQYEQDRFDRLILTAAPHMLGQLRSALPATLNRATLLAEVAKDLTHIPVDEIAEHLSVEPQ